MSHTNRFVDPDDLFIRALPMVRRSDPETSREAAERMVARLRGLQWDVYDYFRTEAPGGKATLLDVENYFDDHGSTYRTRVRELVGQKLLRDSGTKRVQGGSNRTVWEIVPRRDYDAV